MEPQTDREYMIQLTGQVGELTSAIKALNIMIAKLEDGRILPIEIDVENLKTWKAEINGTWKAIGIVSLLVSIAAAIKSFL